MLSNPTVITESVKPKPNSIVQNPGDLSKEFGVHRKENVVGKQEESVGILEVYIHQARDIHNICIYHKQDVYAKIYLTSDPETAVSTQIINGGGKNPIFNQSLRLGVRTIDSLLKCEIWMLSRVRNYLEDQLLGFALVPLSDVFTGNGKLAQEFSLSSSDLFHSPAGFVQLALTYTGASPEVVEISTPRSSAVLNLARQDSEVPISDPNELDKIEFPDPKIVNENEMMVSEYFGVPCDNLESAGAEQLGTTDNGEHHSSQDSGVEITEGFSMGGGLDNVEVSKVETSPRSVSTTASPSVSVPASSQSASDTSGASKPLNQDAVSALKEKIEDFGEAENGSSALPANKLSQPVINVKMEPENKVVQQEIVDMYMKSMQQFTESLAKMKLPLDIDNEPTDSGDTTSDEKVRGYFIHLVSTELQNSSGVCKSKVLKSFGNW
ncbi:hypothetical protein HYC85_014544 [Camellia sinensis]|uniref:C2 domain-containing protein n=1 Tax=Camellia sinensis TaxID=4442 RepID=A0A7J7H7P1_CAMSI|nr:hypothetical protein HYC85_014544 [Camellia sinensis]